MRPNDVAEAVGVSAHQVRKLEAAGVLPPAERTDSGYRVFTGEHVSALSCYRAVTAACGPTLAREIMVRVSAGDVDRALEHVDKIHADLHRERISADETAAVVEHVAADDEKAAAGLTVPPAASGLSIGELSDLLGVRTSALRFWEGAGLLRSVGRDRNGYRVYSVRNVRDARMIHLLRKSGYRLDRIGAVLDSIRNGTGPNQMREIFDDRRKILRSRSRALLKAAALLDEHLNRFHDSSS